MDLNHIIEYMELVDDVCIEPERFYVFRKEGHPLYGLILKARTNHGAVLAFYSHAVYRGISLNSGSLLDKIIGLDYTSGSGLKEKDIDDVTKLLTLNANVVVLNKLSIIDYLQAVEKSSKDQPKINFMDWTENIFIRSKTPHGVLAGYYKYMKTLPDAGYSENRILDVKEIEAVVKIFMTEHVF